MLPIVVIVSISLFDANEESPVTIQKVYGMLSLLGICYNPMKAFRTISISFHDGLHSLNRITQYFDLPDEIPSTLLIKTDSEINVIIKKGTICAYPHSKYDF
jgi:hypothetical protein